MASASAVRFSKSNMAVKQSRIGTERIAPDHYFQSEGKDFLMPYFWTNMKMFLLSDVLADSMYVHFYVLTNEIKVDLDNAL